ncbi:MAG: PEP-CTERM system TPR-repeat protein PrsT [Burkholderiales bacterium]|nr:PEP-CTERM system TPR-repeat protein PrsT [Burkholderiales bacterium]
MKTLRCPAAALAALAVVALLAGCGRGDSASYVASGEGYLAKANYPAAAIEFKNALSRDPENAKARFLLGTALLESGDPVAANTELRKALALRYGGDEVYPVLARAWVQRGAPRAELGEFADMSLTAAHAKAEVAAMLAAAYMSYRQPREAKAQVEAALAIEPANVNARLLGARIMASEKDTKGALAAVDEILVAVPDNLDVLMQKAEIELAIGDRPAATRTLERIVGLRPGIPHARYLLASSYVQAKEFDKAAAQVEVLKKLAPTDVRTLHGVAMVAFARGDIPVALDAVQRALQASPNFLPARYLSGLIDMRRGAYESAEQSLKDVVAKSPGDLGARLGLAQALLMRGQPLRAKELVQGLLKEHPNDASTLRIAGEVELALRQPAKAEEYIERANALDDSNINGRVRLAQVRLAKGETAEGLRELESLSASDAEKREPDVALIQAHLRTHEYDKALAAADALIKKQPKSAFAYNVKGAVYAAKGDLKNARQSYDKAISLDPNLVSALFNLANLDGLERKFADAKTRFEQVLVKEPKSERALLGLTQVLVASGAPAKDVVASLERAVAANPSSPTARQALISYHATQKDWPSAIRAAQAAQAAIPDVPAILELLGAAQIMAGERNQAIETFQRLARLQPDNPVPLMRIGGIHASQKNYADAIVSLKNALSVAPANPAIWIALAAVYAESKSTDAGFAEARRLQKDLTTRTAGYALEAELLAAQKKDAEAIAAYRAALARDPVPLAMVRLHGLLLRSGKPDEAAALAQKWLADHPKDVVVLTHLGQVSLAKSEYQRAADYLRTASEVQPNNVTVLNDLAWALTEAGDPKSVEYAQRAYRLAPNNPAVVNTYGWALAQSGDTTQGIQLLRRALDLDPGSANRRLYLARALIKSGDKAGARKELEIVAKADSAPARTQAEQLLKQL